ncbi:hypothetical protein OPT61_g9850 [Boeremia exigua]|uniref:Uncharacterized protein n=1 Tax=Boeremia exigua TaxID=749465 RepID=A0ACC2HSM7_9PLEO|nr:hypothetical protein OPT61_g9850 [Boeremia exigua]
MDLLDRPTAGMVPLLAPVEQQVFPTRDPAQSPLRKHRCPGVQWALRCHLHGERVTLGAGGCMGSYGRGSLDRAAARAGATSGRMHGAPGGGLAVKLNAPYDRGPSCRLRSRHSSLTQPPRRRVKASVPDLQGQRSKPSSAPPPRPSPIGRRWRFTTPADRLFGHTTPQSCRQRQQTSRPPPARLGAAPPRASRRRRLLPAARPLAPPRRQRTEQQVALRGRGL